MSNFEERFKNWQERMNKKSEKEKHIYAMSVALFFAAVVSFFVISNWYFIISGNEIKTSLFTDLENVFYEQSENFSKSKDALVKDGAELMNVITPPENIYSGEDLGTTTNSTTTDRATTQEQIQ